MSPYSDFGAQESKIYHFFHFPPSICHEVGQEGHDLSFTSSINSAQYSLLFIFPLDIAVVHSQLRVKRNIAWEDSMDGLASLELLWFSHSRQFARCAWSFIQWVPAVCLLPACRVPVCRVPAPCLPMLCCSPCREVRAPEDCGEEGLIALVRKKFSPMVRKWLFDHPQGIYPAQA